MSGPIIRKYGFPNFEKIFGDREIKHGAPPEADDPSVTTGSNSSAREDQGPPPGIDATEEQKASEDSARL